VSIRADVGKGSLTEVRLTVDRGKLRDDPTAMDFLRDHVHVRIIPVDTNRALEYIPRLEAPLGALFRDGGHTSARYSAQTSAMLQTDLALSVLATHYATQLEQAGWQRTGEGSSGPAAWHTWTFQDEEQETWLGRFFLLQMPDRRQEHYLYIQISHTVSERNKWLW